MKYLLEYNQYIKENISLFDEDNWDDEEENDSIPDEFIGHEDFYNFLIDNNILDKWVKNINNKTITINRFDNIKDFLDRNIKIDYIGRCFTWYKTPEGDYYWSNIDDEWRDLNKHAIFGS